MEVCQILPAVLLFLLQLSLDTVQCVYWDYIIVGAGPAGLQMAQHLHKAGRQYVILERANISGSFFELYPRHGRLISINKRHTGKSNHEFNLRHDWNSILSDNKSMLFKHYSKEFFPARESMLRYLADYQATHNLNVKFETDVKNIQRGLNKTSNNLEEELIYQMEDQHGNIFTCRTLILAIGMDKPNIPFYDGMQNTEGYESISINPEDYEGQSVLILGHGNAAFETADAIYGHASVVHIAGRSRVRLAWETHYVGDLRGINNGILDTYQLKSLDGLLEGNFDDIHFHRVDGKIRIDLKGGGLDNFALRHEYDRVIRCLGFTFDDSLFNNTARPLPNRGRIAKYPQIGGDHQVKDRPGMYLIGTASHSLDHRRSSGGFIHGFRYTVKAVHHLLEWKNHRVPWPSLTLGVEELLSHVVKRINEASGIYQMFGMLVDVIALRRRTHEFQYFADFPTKLLPEFEERTGHSLGPCVVLVMQYGRDFSGPGKDVFRESRATAFPHQAHRSNFLHPVFYYYDKPPFAEEMESMPNGYPLPRPQRIHHVVEDFLTMWDSPITHILPLRRFLEFTSRADLRQFYAADCFKFALTATQLPLFCQRHYADGGGLLKDSTVKLDALDEIVPTNKS